MTSPKDPHTRSVSGRLSRAFGTGGNRRAHDPDARFTRNVTIGFIVLIGVTAGILIFALAYGYWEANLKPLASVGGVEVSRADWTVASGSRRSAPIAPTSPRARRWRQARSTRTSPTAASPTPPTPVTPARPPS